VIRPATVREGLVLADGDRCAELDLVAVHQPESARLARDHDATSLCIERRLPNAARLLGLRRDRGRIRRDRGARFRHRGAQPLRSILTIPGTAAATAAAAAGADRAEVARLTTM